MLLSYRSEMKEPSLAAGIKGMTKMFSQYDQRQQAQSAPGWFMTHSAELGLFSLQTFLHQVDVQEKIISAR